MNASLVLPFIGGEHPFSPADFEAIEIASVLMDAENERKKKERFIGIYKTYLPLWIISLDGTNGIMVEALILNSEHFKYRQFDKATELSPERDLTANSTDDLLARLRHFESRLNAYQKEAKANLDGYLNPVIAGEIRQLFEYVLRRDINDLMIMSQRLNQQSAELMCAPLISVYFSDVRQILHDLYQVPILVNTQLTSLFEEMSSTTRNFAGKVQELESHINTLQDEEPFKAQHSKATNLLDELQSFRDTKNRQIKKLQTQWNDINHLSERIQHDYITLINTIFKTKREILQLSTPFSQARQRGQAISVLMPVYLAVFQEKKNRVAYFTPLILNFTKKKDLTRPKGFTQLKNQFDHQYHKKVPPGISELEEMNLLVQPNTQQLFNDGVHQLRETGIIDSKTYVRVMDAYNEFFQKAQGPPKTRL